MNLETTKYSKYTKNKPQKTEGYAPEHNVLGKTQKKGTARGDLESTKHTENREKEGWEKDGAGIFACGNVIK